MNSKVYEIIAPRILQIREEDLRLEVGESEIFAETEYTAISTGTELAAWSGLAPLRPSTVYPRLVGYCNVARVVAVGNRVHEIGVGDYILTHQSHRSAFICQSSQVLLVLKNSNEIIRKKLSTTYLYHLAYSALIKGQFFPGCLVAVVGMGTLGITCASLLRVFGCQPYLFSNQCDLPLFQSPEHTFLKVPFEDEKFKRVVNAEGVDIVINTSNHWTDFLLCLKIVRPGGQIVCLGFPGRGESQAEFNPLSPQFFYDKQVEIKASGLIPDEGLMVGGVRFQKTRNIKYLASLIESNLIDPFTILNLEASWLELKAVYQKLSRRSVGVYSALLNWKL